ncbi:MAG: hypothetical protein KBS83_05210 [Lachnospiraceae bacterium]|nr:hypothetical protein [Candidatus Equihabitans merdae]
MNLYLIAAYFLIYSFLGWAVEVIYHVLKQGIIVNRGYLNGPVCPIYGFGMLAIIFTVGPYEDNTLLVFIGGMILSTVIELIGGWALFHFFHMRWWDYTKEPLNLGGYICARFTIFWGIGTVLVMDIAHPLVYTFVYLIPTGIGIILMIGLYAVYVVDMVATTMTVMKMKKEFERLEQMAAAMRRVSDSLTQKIGDKTMSVDQKMDETRVQVALGKAELRDKFEETQEGIEKSLAEAKVERAIRKEERQTHREEYIHMAKEELEEKYLELMIKREEVVKRLTASKFFGSGRILNAFPNLKSVPGLKKVTGLVNRKENENG